MAEPFDNNLMMTALCLWEAYIDREYANPKTFHTEVRGEIGSFALRQAITNVVRDVEALWDSLGDDLQDGWTFDFEFCPDVISHAIDWSTLIEHEKVALFPDAKERLLAHRGIEEKFAA